MIKYVAKDGFIHRQIAGIDVLVSFGGNVANFNGYIQLNPTAVFIWQQLQDPVEIEELINRITGEYEVPYDLARKDVISFIRELESKDMVAVYEE